MYIGGPVHACISKRSTVLHHQATYYLRGLLPVHWTFKKDNHVSHGTSGSSYPFLYRLSSIPSAFLVVPEDLVRAIMEPV